MIKKYDLIVVLGYGFSSHWNLPEKSKIALNKAVSLYQKKLASKIAVCGKWSINWDQKKITPPTTEAEEMKKFLLKLKIPFSSIYKEEYSKDTIGNAFFLKTKICQKNHFKKLLIICTDYHLDRVKFIFQKIFDKDYQINFFPIETKEGKDKKIISLQQKIFQNQKEFLKEMKNGDDFFLKSRLYNDLYYKRKREKKVSLYAGGSWLEYLNDFRNFLSSYKNLVYLKGNRLPYLNLFPKIEGYSGFLIFLGKKKKKEIILKILWEKKYEKRFNTEIFVLNDFPKKFSFIKNKLPKIYHYSFEKINFFETNYLNDYQSLGDYHQITNNSFSRKILEKILTTINIFHQPIANLPTFDFSYVRNSYFYQEKLFKLDTGTRIENFFGKNQRTKIETIFLKNKDKLNNKISFVLGDRNPSNILVKNKTIKLIDFDRSGVGNPAIDFTFLYICLIDSSLLKFFLSFLKKNYSKVKNFWFHFWYDTLQRLVDEIYYWEKKDKKRFFILKNNFLSICDKLFNNNESSFNMF